MNLVPIECRVFNQLHYIRDRMDAGAAFGMCKLCPYTYRAATPIYKIERENNYTADGNMAVKHCFLLISMLYLSMLLDLEQYKLYIGIVY